MKVGIHQHVFTRNLFDSNLDLLNVIRDYGFDCLDVNVRILDLPGARRIRKRAEGLGLHLLGGGSLPADKELLSGDPQKRREAIEYMKGLVQKVHELGSTFYGGIIYAPFSRLTGKAPTTEEFERSAAGLRRSLATRRASDQRGAGAGQPLRNLPHQHDRDGCGWPTRSAKRTWGSC
jgi:sugar phosphate isomerase/epimerase